MTSHELARLLLSEPDMPVIYLTSWGYDLLSEENIRIDTVSFDKRGYHSFQTGMLDYDGNPCIDTKVTII